MGSCPVPRQACCPAVSIASLDMTPAVLEVLCKMIFFVCQKRKMSQIPLLAVALWDQRHLIFFFNEKIVFS